MAIEITVPDLVPEVHLYFRKFGERALVEIFDALEKIGQEEVRNTRSRLDRRSSMSGSIFSRVSDEVLYTVIEGPRGFPMLRFGAGENFGGVRGKRGADIAHILAFGKAKGRPSRQKVFAEYKKTANKILLPKGYVSPEREPEDAFFPKAKSNIEEKIQKKIPEALRKAFNEVKI